MNYNIGEYLSFKLNRKQKMEAQEIFLNPFTVCHCANRGLSFVRLVMRKHMEVICLQTD
jgi:hypothetical protein